MDYVFCVFFEMINKELIMIVLFGVGCFVVLERIVEDFKIWNFIMVSNLVIVFLMVVCVLLCEC